MYWDLHLLNLMTLSSNNLLSLLLKMNEKEAASKLFQDHLAWLLDRDPTMLGAVQREVQGQLKNMVKLQDDDPDKGRNPKRG